MGGASAAGAASLLTHRNMTWTAALRSGHAALSACSRWRVSASPGWASQRGLFGVRTRKWSITIEAPSWATGAHPRREETVVRYDQQR